MQIGSDLIPVRKTFDYSEYVESLRWRTAGDPLFRDGSDHSQIDWERFQRALRTLGSLENATLCDIGSFPGYGLWASAPIGIAMSLGRSSIQSGLSAILRILKAC